MTALLAVSTILNFTNILHYDVTVSASYGMLLITGVLLIIYTFQIKTFGSRETE